MYLKNHKTQWNSREGMANSSRDVYWAKLHNNWCSLANTPSLSPTVVASLCVSYSRHRSSPETFFSPRKFVRDERHSWTKVPLYMYSARDSEILFLISWNMKITYLPSSTCTCCRNSEYFFFKSLWINKFMLGIWVTFIELSSTEFVSHQILFGWSNQRGWDRHCMRQVWGKTEKHTRWWSETIRKETLGRPRHTVGNIRL
jgi:hypothetical protein